MDFTDDFQMSPMSMKRSDSVPSSITVDQDSESDTTSVHSLGITDKMQRLEIKSNEVFGQAANQGESIFRSIKDFSRSYLENRVDF